MNKLSKTEIINLIQSNSRGYASILKNRHADVIASVKEQFGAYSVENLYRWLYDILETPVCKCGKRTSFRNIKNGYLSYCSVSCIDYEERNEKSKKSNIKKYGVDNPMKIVAVKEKTKNTCLERYGVSSPMKCDKIKSKYKNNFINKHGVDNPMKIVAVKEKTKNTCLERYGVENSSKNTIIRDRQLETFKKTIYSRFNMFKNISPLFTIDEYNWSKNNTYKWLCNVCNKEFFDYIYNGHNPSCPNCNRSPKSSPQLEISDFLQETISQNIKLNDRTVIKPYELDILVIDKKVAIEYCGLYWHGERSGTERKYHYNKLKMANDAGWRLITIFEDEWKEKKEICKNRLAYILKEERPLFKIFARNCQITDISSTTFNSFLKNTHIQGPITNVSVKLGAFYNNKLVAVMGFSKLRRALGSSSAEGEYELVRFAASQNIPGIGSKLLSNFIRKHNPQSIISYCDLRWGTGNFYDKLGFTFDSITMPNYWYFKTGTIKREHRFKYTKKSIIKKFNEDPNKTEWQIMQSMGYDRIWDCGNLKYIWRKS